MKRYITAISILGIFLVSGFAYAQTSLNSTTNLLTSDPTTVNQTSAQEPSVSQSTTTEPEQNTVVAEPKPVLYTDTQNTIERPHAILALSSGGEEVISGDIISGVLNARVITKGAKEVVLYITQTDTDRKKITELKQSEVRESLWTGRWDTTTVPNGKYLILIFITNEFGNYRGASVGVGINNGNVGILEKQPIEDGIEADNVEHETAISEKPALETRREVIFEECKTDAECREVCAGEENKDECKDYIQEHIISETAVQVRSVTDYVAPGRVDTVLERSTGPGGCGSVEECRSYCSDSTHDNECSDFLREHDFLSRAEIKDRQKLLQQAREERARVIKERIGARISLDSDSDSIPDYDEINIYGTNPNDADTDSDGVPDGVELLAHTSPLINPKDVSVASVEDGTRDTTEEVVETDTIKYENPQDAGEFDDEIFAVDEVAIEMTTLDVEISENLVLSGKAPANSLVTLFIFSTPIVVAMKTNEDGSWEYTLTRELEDGTHEAYVAITDSNGKIFAKSRALPFVKEAQAISVGEAILGAGEAETPNLVVASYTLTFILIFILGAIFIFIGFRMKGKEEDIL